MIASCGDYLNAETLDFTKVRKSGYYVDKTALIKVLNEGLECNRRFVCITRPRRFGKSLTADMLCAYYGHGKDTSTLFEGLKISQDPSYRKHLNSYNVVFINMAHEYNGASHDVAVMKSCLTERIVMELRTAYPDLQLRDPLKLRKVFEDVFALTHVPFVIVMDEWDVILRETRNDAREIDDYLRWLNILLKDKSYIGLAYLTGILPIKKCGTNGILNMFDEYSMIEPHKYASYIGFTDDEVWELCRKYPVDAASMKQWYAGYAFEKCPAVYNPKSVVSALETGKIANYWSEIESYEALQRYIDLETDGLRQDIVTLLSGSFVYVDVTRFANDMVTLDSKNAVLTLLIHLGYLALDPDAPGKFGMQAVRIPNQEIRDEFLSAIKDDSRYAEIDGLL